MTNLAPSEEVDVGALAGIFGATTNSYKHLFFQGLLSLLRNRHPEARFLALSSVGVEMLALAWYPHSYFGVSFGRQDQVSRVLGQLVFSLGGGAIGSHSNQIALRQAIRSQAETINLASLLRYVPYRLLRPFFTGQLAGLSDGAKNRRTQNLASDEFNQTRPLYRFVDVKEEPGIEVHPAWMSYLQANHAIVQGWAERQWLAFLQNRNPATPALTEKITPPASRSSLATQIRFWETIMTEWKVPCLYSGKPLGPGEFALDHFVPWAFVCHDRPWNLTPVLPEVNAAKGHSLPDEKYLPHLAKIQAKSLAVFRELVGSQSDRFNRLTEPYLIDLGLTEAELGKPEATTKAYKNTVAPLLALARNSGFPPDWVY